MLELIGLFWKSDIIDSEETAPSNSCYSPPLSYRSRFSLVTFLDVKCTWSTAPPWLFMFWLLLF